ncbi:MAG: redox-sensing transcriptional repressor Rex [Spirochaetaceae bacterium]|nr:MAG: redox-sensing transcriptional repressor Rex [Spirochaetaceae bacterium]
MSEHIILRLARYLRVLQKLRSLGFVKVFSNNLGDAIGVTPAVVRKDFSMISITGNKRGGYTIDYLIPELERILGKRETQDVVLVGCGKIGRALMEYQEFKKEGIIIKAAFDVDESRIGSHSDIPVLHTGKLADYVVENGIRVGILAVPDTSAASVFEIMMQAGIRGFLNFTTVELKCSGKCPDDGCESECIVQNVNISLEIENLFYLVNLKSSLHSVS